MKVKFILLMLLSVFLFAACSSSDDEENKDPQSPGTEDPDYDDAEALELPNTYIIGSGKSLEIPVSKACAVWRNDVDLKATNPKLEGKVTAELIWMDAEGLISNANSLTVEGEGVNAIIKLNTATGKNGNALIAVRIGDYVSSPEENPIRWSWHVWVTDEDVTAKTYQLNGYTFMDRDLGALSATKGDVKTIGLHYQWGRKDPFKGYADFAGTAGTIYNKNNEIITGTPNGVIVKKKSASLAESVEAPNSFYYGSEDWLSTRNDALWGHGSNKTLFDPCPEGWRVPKDGAWEGVDPLAATGDYAIDKGWTWENLGYYAAAGIRHRSNDGTLFYPGTRGYAWSASPSTKTDGRSFCFQCVSATNITTSADTHRTYGMPVRCVKE